MSWQAAEKPQHLRGGSFLSCVPGYSHAMGGGRRKLREPPGNGTSGVTGPHPETNAKTVGDARDRAPSGPPELRTVRPDPGVA